MRKNKTLYPSKFLPTGSFRESVDGVRMWNINGKHFLSKGEYFQFLRDDALAKKAAIQPTQEVAEVAFDCPTCGKTLAVHVGDNTVVGVSCLTGCELSVDLVEQLKVAYTKSLQYFASLNDKRVGVGPIEAAQEAE